MFVLSSLLLMMACKIIEPPPAFQSDTPAPVAPKPTSVASASEKPTPEVASKPSEPLARMARVATRQSLVWASADIKRPTVALLRQGQVVLIKTGVDGPAVVWQDQNAHLVKVEAKGISGWMIEGELEELSLPTWATALTGVYDPFENPEQVCGEKAPLPWAGGEFRLVERTGGDRVRYEVGCLEKSAEGIATASSRSNETSLLDFAWISQTKTCLRRLESMGAPDDALKKVWPQDPALCELLKIESVVPPFPGMAASYKIDLVGGEHPAEGFVGAYGIGGTTRWLETHLTDGKRIFDGPNYTLLAQVAGDRFKVIRISFYPPSWLEVLDKPMTGDEAEAFASGPAGAVQGSSGTACIWQPGMKQYYICN